MLAVYRIAADASIPILAHISLGSCETHRDYAADIDAIMTTHPNLTLVLAHFGLGFDAVTLPKMHELLAAHGNLFIDTSLYGGAREKWFGRASRRVDALRETVRAFPRQVLFGTDTYGWRGRGVEAHAAAMRASCLHLEADSLTIPELRRSAAYFDAKAVDEYGPRCFDEVWKGLLLRKEPAVLRMVLRENAVRLLGEKGDVESAALPNAPPPDAPPSPRDRSCAGTST
jgi:predicted TIM-barrel fold metal-dependent hydrolase